MRINYSSSAIPPRSEFQKAEPSYKSDKTDKTEVANKTEKKDKRVEKLEEMRNNYTMLSERLEELREQDKASAEGAKIRIKCMKIAMRIVSGDEVPPEDHRFLVKHDPGLYGKSIMMRMQKENPEKHKRISRDEEINEKIDIESRGDYQSPAENAAAVNENEYAGE